MNPVLRTLGALALGAGAAYYFDPAQGRRRRALVGDQINSASHDARDYLAAKGKRAGDQARGLVATARSALSFEAPSDRQLHERVRARLGRLVSYPHAIETDVVAGRVILRGAVLAREHPALVAGVWAMRGVRGIDNHLSLHETPKGVPGMQGKPHRGRRPLGIFASSAIPALALAGSVSAGLGALRRNGTDRTGPLSLAMGLLAFGLGDSARRLARQRHALPEKSETIGTGMESTAQGTGEEDELRQPSGQAGTPAVPPAGPVQSWH